MPRLQRRVEVKKQNKENNSIRSGLVEQSLPNELTDLSWMTFDKTSHKIK